MKFDFSVERARFISRPNRFLVIAQLAASGETVRVHCPDPGRLRELLLPDATVYVSPAAGTGRKTSHVLRFVEHPDPRANKQLISLDSRLPNQLVAEGLAEDAFPWFRGYTQVEREVRIPEAVAGAGVRSRIDYRLSGPVQPTCWLEVKSVTLVEGRRALFPDAVTARGRRHVLELAHLHELAGDRAAVLFIVQRPDVDVFSPQIDRDPEFGAALQAAHARGVEVYACRCRLTQTAIELAGPIPVDLLTEPG